MKMIICFVFLIAFIGCENKSAWDKKYPSLVNKKIRYTDNLVPYNTEDLEFISKSGNKTLINVVTASCSPCVGELIYWEDIVDNYIDQDVNLVFIAQGKTDYYFEKSVLEKYKLDIPIFLDEDSSFVKTNELLPALYERTMVLNEDEEIVFIGSPYYDPSKFSAFLQIINN